MVADSLATLAQGNRNGEEDYAEPAVDEVRGAHAEDARA
jgi:hypothetical protein